MRSRWAVLPEVGAVGRTVPQLRAGHVQDRLRLRSAVSRAASRAAPGGIVSQLTAAADMRFSSGGDADASSDDDAGPVIGRPVFPRFLSVAGGQRTCYDRRRRPGVSVR